MSTTPCSHDPTLLGYRTERIEGSYRPITVHMLTLAWWLHASGHLTRRQLRVWFACHEMAERRRYTKSGRKPSYSVDEVLRLVGGRGDELKARSEIARDLDRLAEVGLVEFAPDALALATSADQIKVDDLCGYWSMLEQMPNARRAVPVPRRMVRALAAGFSRATTALIFATLIRGLFWHRGRGDYRTDGRYKLSWVSEHFGVSRRALTEARSTLIELGWLEPIDVNQWEMNRWGLRDRIVTDWSPSPNAAAVGEGGQAAESDESPSAQSASPRHKKSAGSSSPVQTGSPSLTRESLNTRNPAPPAEHGRAGPSGVSPTGSTGSRRRESIRSRRDLPGGKPSIREIRASDLASTERLLELYEQAVRLGLIGGSEAGRLAFFSLAERARSRGHRAGALFFWLLRERKFSYITQHDEDEASRRIRELMNGPSVQTGQQQWGRAGQDAHPEPQQEREFTDDERVAIACIRAANKSRTQDGFYFARAGKGWTRDRWDEAVRAIEERELKRLRQSHSNSFEAEFAF